MTGLQVWDASGNLTVDTSTSVGNIIGNISTGTGSGSVTVPNFTQGTPFYLVVPFSNDRGYYYSGPVVSISGTTLSWHFTVSSTYAVNSTIYYGVR